MTTTRGYFGTWKEATKDQALDLARHIYYHSTMPKDKVLKVINEKHIQGITIYERDIKAGY